MKKITASVKKHKVFDRVKKKKCTKINIAFDLDHTLIVSELKLTSKNLNLSNRKPLTFNISDRHIWVRPYAYHVLSKLSSVANLYLFTHATKNYADSICKFGKFDKYFKKKLYRENCNQNGKDLSAILKNTKSVILVDDLLSNSYNNQNFYHITRYSPENKFDRDLMKLLDYFSSV